MKTSKIKFLYLIFFISILLISNTDKKINITGEQSMNNIYDSLWDKISEFETKGLSKSALDEIKKVYDLAKKEKNSNQLIKAIIYQMKFRAMLEEYSHENIIKDVEEEIKNYNAPEKNILYSLLAEIYFQYYQANSYQFLERTAVEDNKDADISTWDLRTLFNKINESYLKSLENKELLKSISIKKYNEVIFIEESTMDLRPTLFDFLSHRAIDYFSNDQAYLTQPAYKFVINEDTFFNSADKFINIKIDTKDTESNKLRSILLFQELLGFHIKDKNPEAFIDSDLKRINFIYVNSVNENKKQLYLKALETLINKYKNQPIAAKVVYDYANCFFNEGNAYNTQKEDYKWSKKKAYDLCEEFIPKFKDSPYLINLIYLKNAILRKNIDFQIEKVNIPEKPFLSLIRYQNLTNIFIRIIKLNKNEKTDFEENYYSHDEKFINKIKGFKPVKEWQVELPADNDYNMHSAEINFPELNPGYYLILLGTDKDFTTYNNAICYSRLWISDISFITRNNSTTGTVDVSVFSRSSGGPLTQVSAVIYEQVYDNIKNRYKKIKKETYSTDRDGSFTVASKNNRSFWIEFINDKDSLFTDQSLYQYFPYKNESGRYKTFFFTDRSIYRPGQTIYFKGIVIEQNKKINNIAVKHNVNVEFYDVNSQKISDATFTTNEFGTFSGAFTSPTGRLNGLMYIRTSDNSGETSVSVEEYKRPKFEASFKPVEESFKINDNVKVTGFAKSFAGSNIDGAAVNYRVVRIAEFPYWYWYWGYYPSQEEMEILNGQTQTDQKGEFTINFNAIPDLSISKEKQPVFSYYIYADVTDINGETHSTQTSVRVGYVALQININLPALINKSTDTVYDIQSLNLNYQPENSSGSIKIYKLKSPDKKYKEKFWEKPDKFIIPQGQYEKDFPNDVYNDEDNFYKWEKGKIFTDTAFNTSNSKKFKIANIDKFETGKYLLHLATKDKFNNEINLYKYFDVYSANIDSLPDYMTSFYNPEKVQGEPGDEALIAIGSSDDLTVLYEIENENQIIEKSWIKINNQIRQIKIPIEEKHRGVFTAHFSYIKHNRFYTYSSYIHVPWSNKELKISFETFRDKLKPGENEEWKIKISGPNKDKVLAEMAATLYDASLDEFRSHYWNFSVYPYYYPTLYWQGSYSFIAANSTLFNNDLNPYNDYHTYRYSYLNWYGFSFYYNRYYYRKSGPKRNDLMMAESSKEESLGMVDEKAPMPGKQKSKDGEDKATKNNVQEPAPVITQKTEDKKTSGNEEIKVRKNFNETAFFYPNLKTDENGNVIIKFIVPEALTRWKMLGFAHTKNLEYGFIENTLVTQKDIMVMPNLPRFVRESDKIVISAKISNISKKDLNGTASLMLFDAMTAQSVDIDLKNNKKDQEFKVGKESSTVVNWEIEIPDTVKALTFRILAKTESFTDGEETTLPVLTNRILVTESLPLPVIKKGEKTFKMEKLLKSGQSSTIKHERLTLEFTSNPVWYAIQSLPYLMEYPYECIEQTFSRLYADSIASFIANSNPKIKDIFDSWKNTDALLSNLEKNQELKSLLLEETPWVLEAKNESERKKMVGILFDLNRMSNESEQAIKKITDAQLPNGGFPWFQGLPDDRYITQHIISGIGRLQKIGVDLVKSDDRISNMTEKGIYYLDDKMRKDYEYLIKHNVSLNQDNLSYITIHYLYARSFYKEMEIEPKNKKAFEYWKSQITKYWLNYSIYMQGMMAVSLKRFGDNKTSSDITRSLKENSITHEELGMYWKNNIPGYYWYNAPVETQSLLIEAFYEVDNDIESVEAMKLWLLKQKQTQNWPTTKATTDACYALILKGKSWIDTDEAVKIKLGDIMFDPLKDKDTNVEKGTGYFKKSWQGSEINIKMGEITVYKQYNSVSWGSLYWQYFEQLDKITGHETPLSLKKDLFIEVNTDKGPVLKPVNNNTKLKPGDLIKVRIKLKVDRDMEYIHMKDMRASGLEPINVISNYKYQDGLWYYESTKDASTNFFFPALYKGSYVFEYPLRVNSRGNFSNGITTIQCMYAPEFTSHSEGVRIEVK